MVPDSKREAERQKYRQVLKIVSGRRYRAGRSGYYGEGGDCRCKHPCDAADHNKLDACGQHFMVVALSNLRGGYGHG